MSKGKNEEPPSAEKARRENFLVAKGMKRNEARDTMPPGKDRKAAAELLKERLRQSPRKKKPKCVGTDALSGLASCTIAQKKSGTKMKVTATATDKAGNVSVTTLTYKVKPKPKK